MSSINISQDNNTNPYNESEVNQLRINLNKEKNKNLVLTNENKNLKKRLNELNNEIEKMKKQKTLEIDYLNNEIEKMKKKIKILKNDLSNKDLEIQNYLSQNNENKNVITSIKPGERIIGVNFVSMGTNDIGHYNLVCKNTDLFVRLEERLYEDFPQFKDYETIFEVNTRRIRRFKTLDENYIKSNDIINIYIENN